MINKDLEKKYKEDGFEYAFYKNLEENFEKAEEKDKWLVENFNATNKELSERLTWMVGVGIALLPLIFEFMPPLLKFHTGILILALGSSFFSILSISINFLITQNFWEKHAQKNRFAVKIWYDGMKEISENYPKEEEEIHDKTHHKIEKLHLEENPITTRFWTKTQIITGLLSVLLFICYLIVYAIF